MSSTEQKKRPHKIAFDHGEYFEIQDPEGNMKRYTREQAETLQSVMDGFIWHVVVFKNYSQVRV